MPTLGLNTLQPKRSLWTALGAGHAPVGHTLGTRRAHTACCLAHAACYSRHRLPIHVPTRICVLIHVHMYLRTNGDGGWTEQGCGSDEGQEEGLLLLDATLAGSCLPEFDYPAGWNLHLDAQDAPPLCTYLLFSLFYRLSFPVYLLSSRFYLLSSLFYLQSFISYLLSLVLYLLFSSVRAKRQRMMCCWPAALLQHRRNGRERDGVQKIRLFCRHYTHWSLGSRFRV